MTEYIDQERTAVVIRMKGHEQTGFAILGEPADPATISRKVSEFVYPMVNTPTEAGQTHQLMVGVRAYDEGYGQIQISDHTGILGEGEYVHYHYEGPAREEA